MCYARRISFEINSNSKEIRRAEHEYINKLPPLVTSLILKIYQWSQNARYFALHESVTFLQSFMIVFFYVEAAMGVNVNAQVDSNSKYVSTVLR